MGEDGYFEYYVSIYEYAKEKCLNFLNIQYTEHVSKARGDGGGEG